MNIRINWTEVGKNAVQLAVSVTTGIMVGRRTKDLTQGFGSLASVVTELVAAEVVYALCFEGMEKVLDCKYDWGEIKIK